MKKKRGKRQVCAFALFLPFTYTLTHLVVSEIIAKIFGGWVLKEFKMIKLSAICQGWGRGGDPLRAKTFYKFKMKPW